MENRKCYSSEGGRRYISTRWWELVQSSCEFKKTFARRSVRTLKKDVKVECWRLWQGMQIINRKQPLQRFGCFRKCVFHDSLTSCHHLRYLDLLIPQNFLPPFSKRVWVNVYDERVGAGHAKPSGAGTWSRGGESFHGNCNRKLCIVQRQWERWEWCLPSSEGRSQKGLVERRRNVPCSEKPKQIRTGRLGVGELHFFAVFFLWPR